MPLAAQTISDMEYVCTEQCGPPTWQIAVPQGGVPELTRQGDVLVVSVLLRQQNERRYVLLTTEMPAAAEGHEPERNWLHRQPSTVVLRWTIEATALEYVAPLVRVQSGRSGRLPRLVRR
jgi:hypothetical protein